MRKEVFYFIGLAVMACAMSIGIMACEEDDWDELDANAPDSAVANDVRNMGPAAQYSPGQDFAYQLVGKAKKNKHMEIRQSSLKNSTADQSLSGLSTEADLDNQSISPRVDHSIAGRTASGETSALADPLVGAGTPFNEWLEIMGTSTAVAPYLKLNHYTDVNADWVFQNSGGNLYIRRSTAGGSGITGERVTFRTTFAPKSAIEMSGYQNDGNGDGDGVLRLKTQGTNPIETMILDGDSVDTWLVGSSSTTGGALYINKNSGGAVGIGTNKVSGYKLAVEGKIHAREIVVDSTTWADNVFADDYPLMSLGEIERYIKQNRHLPEVPSAAQVSQDGVAVSEMQTTLLRKVEELTLHVIEQEKQIRELKGIIGHSSGNKR